METTPIIATSDGGKRTNLVRPEAHFAHGLKLRLTDVDTVKFNGYDVVVFKTTDLTGAPASDLYYTMVGRDERNWETGVALEKTGTFNRLVKEIYLADEKKAAEAIQRGETEITKLSDLEIAKSALTKLKKLNKDCQVQIMRLRPFYKQDFNSGKPRLTTLVEVYVGSFSTADETAAKQARAAIIK